jgi:esterase/lipase superfamily enzyme
MLSSSKSYCLSSLLGERSDRSPKGEGGVLTFTTSPEPADCCLAEYVVAPAANTVASNECLARARLDLRSKPGLHVRRAGPVAVLLLASLLTGCASRHEVGALLANHEVSSRAKDHTILVATTRERDPRPGTYFGGERSQSVSYATVTVAVPPMHVPGKIEWPSQAPGNPTTDFVVRDAAYLDSEREFVKALNAQLAMRPPGRRRVFVFIHGYNTMFAEGLYRFTQIVDDANAPGVPVLFTWASRGHLTDYVYDSNSATAARDELEHTLRLVLASNAEEINILAHSMGNWVTVEALRQIKISGKLPPVSKLGAVVLAAPDIDIDVFKAQMRRFGKPRKPFFIIVSHDDKALRFSDFIAGGKQRLGAYSNDAELTALGAVVIDMTNVKADDPSNHAKFAQLAEIAPEMREVLERGVATPGGSDAVKGQGTLASVVQGPGGLGAPIWIVRGSQ